MKCKIMRSHQYFFANLRISVFILLNLDKNFPALYFISPKNIAIFDFYGLQKPFLILHVTNFLQINKNNIFILIINIKKRINYENRTNK